VSCPRSIDKQTYRKYLRTFENGGQAPLFARQTKSNRKYDNEAVKQAVFGLLHEPPSNYGINRTTWIMRDLSRVLREAGWPACPEVIRKITKAAGYRWRKARVVLTSSDPNYTEKLGRIRSILSGLGPRRSVLLDRRVRSVRREDETRPHPHRPRRTACCSAVAEVPRLHA
jgi:hypothetical protein